MRGILLRAMAAFLLTSSAAHAEFNYISQFRSVFASAGQGGGPSVSELKQTVALGCWSEIAAAVYGDEFGSASGAASQISNLASDEISMSSASSAAGNAGFTSGASSNLDVTFSLLTDTSYVSAFGTTAPLNANAGFYPPVSGQPYPYTINGSGILPAGVYRLTVSLGASAGGESVSDATHSESRSPAYPNPRPSSWSPSLMLRCLLASGRSFLSTILPCPA